MNRLLMFALLNLLINLLTLLVLAYWGVRYMRIFNNFLKENFIVTDDFKKLLGSVSNIERVVLKHDK